MTQSLFDEWDSPPIQTEQKHLIEVALPPKYDNPCMALYGRGPQGVQCKDCDHLVRVRHHDKTYLKCDLRSITHGAGSDHRAHWYACGRFKPEQKEQ